jgi:hypothetical protein
MDLGKLLYRNKCLVLIQMVLVLENLLFQESNDDFV